MIDKTLNNEKIYKICECFASGIFCYGGMEELVLNILKSIDDNNFTFSLFVPGFINNEKLTKLASEKNIKVISGNVDSNKIFRRLKTIKAFKNMFKRNKFDIVHIHGAGSFDLALIARVTKKAGIKKVIVHSHNTGIENFKNCIKRKICENLYLKYADIFCACSIAAAKWMFPKKIIETGKYNIINNGININKFLFNKETRNLYRKKLKLENSLTILNVGRFSEQKNHKFIIEVVDKLKDKIKNLKVVLIGEGELKEQTLQTIKQRGLEKYFIVLEKRTDIPEIMMASDLFILPSLFEGLPVVAIEAQATGLVTLCSTNITEEVKVTDLCKMIGIDNVDIWVEEINKTYAQLQEKETKVNREKYSKIMKDAGYDAKQSAKLLEDIYIG